MLQANNLTVCLPSEGCDKNCPYCVSRMTSPPRPAPDLLWRNIPKVVSIARLARASSVLLTGRGEPFLDFDCVLRLCREFGRWPLEIQTNGRALNAHRDAWIPALHEAGLDLVAVSVDRLEQFEAYAGLFQAIRDRGMTARVTLNLTAMIPEETTFDALLDLCLRHGVAQFMLRNITVPRHASRESPEARWIAAHADASRWEALQREAGDACRARGSLRRRLNFGGLLYDYRGVSVTTSDYCIQDINEGTDIRSLILDWDGHVYTAWDSRASRLF